MADQARLNPPWLGKIKQSNITVDQHLRNIGTDKTVKELIQSINDNVVIPPAPRHVSTNKTVEIYLKDVKDYLRNNKSRYINMYDRPFRDILNKIDLDIETLLGTLIQSASDKQLLMRLIRYPPYGLSDPLFQKVNSVAEFVSYHDEIERVFRNLKDSIGLNCGYQFTKSSKETISKIPNFIVPKLSSVSYYEEINKFYDEFVNYIVGCIDYYKKNPNFLELYIDRRIKTPAHQISNELIDEVNKYRELLTNTKPDSFLSYKIIPGELFWISLDLGFERNDGKNKIMFPIMDVKETKVIEEDLIDLDDNQED